MYVSMACRPVIEVIERRRIGIDEIYIYIVQASFAVAGDSNQRVLTICFDLGFSCNLAVARLAARSAARLESSAWEWPRPCWASGAHGRLLRAGEQQREIPVAIEIAIAPGVLYRKGPLFIHKGAPSTARPVSVFPRHHDFPRSGLAASGSTDLRHDH